MAIAVCQDVGCALVGLEVFSLFLLFGALTLITQVPDLLRPGIELAKLPDRVRLAGQDARGFVGDLAAPADEAFSLVIPFAPGFLPEFVCAGHLLPAIKEAYLRLVIVFRRHVTLGLKRRHVLQLQFVAITFLPRLYIGRHARSKHRHLMSFLKAIQHPAKWLHAEALFHGVKLVLNGPEIVEVNSGNIEPVLVLDDAVDGNFGHGEGEREDLQAALLQQQFFERLAGKVDDLAVRTYGAGLQAADGAVRRYGDFDVSIAHALVIEHLDAAIEEFCLLLIVNVVGVVKLDGGSARDARRRRQPQVLLRDGKPVLLLRGRRQSTKKQDQRKKTAQHQCGTLTWQRSRRNIAPWRGGLPIARSSSVGRLGFFGSINAKHGLAAVTFLHDGKELLQLAVLPRRNLQSVKAQLPFGDQLAVLKRGGDFVAGIGQTGLAAIGRRFQGVAVRQLQVELIGLGERIRKDDGRLHL